MLKKFILISILFFIASCSSPQDYSQSYIIVMNREKVGKEIVNEKTDRKGSRICISEQELDSGPGVKEKKQRIVNTRMVIPQGEIFPVSYTYETNAGTNYDMKVEDGKIIRTFKNKEETQVQEIPFERGMPILNLNVYHTIDYWIRKYDVKKGGEQSFATYLLPSGSIVKMVVTPSQLSLPEHEAESVKLKYYQIEMDNEITMLLWVDQESRLYRMLIQGPNIEVIRSDLFSKIEKEMNQDINNP